MIGEPRRNPRPKWAGSILRLLPHVFLLFASLAAFACAGEPADRTGRLVVEEGVVYGAVVDEGGRPEYGASIVISVFAVDCAGSQPVFQPMIAESGGNGTWRQIVRGPFPWAVACLVVEATTPDGRRGMVRDSLLTLRPDDGPRIDSVRVDVVVPPAGTSG